MAARPRALPHGHDGARDQARGGDESETAVWLPAMAERNGASDHRARISPGDRLGAADRHFGVGRVVFSDRIDNPVLEAMGHFARASLQASGVLFDPGSDLMRAAGPAFSSTGVQASLEHRLPGGNHVRVSYASGAALVMPTLSRQPRLGEVLGAVHSRHAQTYAIALSGTLDGTETRWRASYSWQPDDTVTEVAPFDAGCSVAVPQCQAQPAHSYRPRWLGRPGGIARGEESAGRRLSPVYPERRLVAAVR